MEPKGRGAIEYLPELLRIHLPRTMVNSGPGLFSRRDARLRGARFYRVGA